MKNANTKMEEMKMDPALDTISCNLTEANANELNE
jgi:hypothetical protein